MEAIIELRQTAITRVGGQLSLARSADPKDALIADLRERVERIEAMNVLRQNQPVTYADLQELLKFLGVDETARAVGGAKGISETPRANSRLITGIASGVEAVGAAGLARWTGKSWKPSNGCGSESIDRTGTTARKNKPRTLPPLVLLSINACC